MQKHETTKPISSLSTNYLSLTLSIRTTFITLNLNKMIVTELKDFEVYRDTDKNFVYLFVTLWDEGDTDTNAEILAEYEIEIYDSYSNYKITKKYYNEILTIKQTRDCDDYLEKIYEANTFEDAYVQEYNDEGTWWFI